MKSKLSRLPQTGSGRTKGLLPRKLIILSALAAMISLHSSAAAQATLEHAEFSARDISEKIHPAHEANSKATLWAFISHDCPLSNAYAPEICRLAAEYRARGVTLNLVYAETDFGREELAEHARAFGYKFSGDITLFADPNLRVAKACGIKVTPEVAVVGSDGSLLYRGRIDNRSLAPGRPREKITSHDLRMALDALLAGRSIAHARTSPVGCALNFP